MIIGKSLCRVRIYNTRSAQFIDFEIQSYIQSYINDIQSLWIWVIQYESKMNVQSKWIIWNKSKSIFWILKINHNYYQNVTQTFRFSCIYVKISKCSRIRLPQTCIFITTYSYFQIFNVFLVFQILVPWNGLFFSKLIYLNQKSSQFIKYDSYLMI